MKEIPLLKQSKGGVSITLRAGVNYPADPLCVVPSAPSCFRLKHLSSSYHVRGVALLVLYIVVNRDIALRI